MTGGWFEFERPLVELERRIQELRDLSRAENLGLHGELRRLEERAEKLRRDIYERLTRWQRVQLARHPRRPYTLDYISRLTEDFIELHGDRLFRDDRAVVGGPALLGGRRVMIIGHEKGKDTRENLERNFGMAHPEGYRKALRLMQMAAKFRMPIITLIDTPGAYPGIGAEERGQAEAIARNLFTMSRLPVPIVVSVIGEGGSGGALALGVGDRVIMLEYAIYSVISPEGCAAILWNDRAQAPRAAEALRLTAPDLLELGVIDEIVPEPPGGAHRDHDQAARFLGDALERHLASVVNLPVDELLRRRMLKYGRMGVRQETEITAGPETPREESPPAPGLATESSPDVVEAEDPGGELEVGLEGDPGESVENRGSASALYSA